MEKHLVKYSKFLSLVLRHAPEEIGIELDTQGWTDVKILLQKCKAKGISMSHADLLQVVEENPKKRFAFSDDGTKIRANQGHSIQVELGYAPTTPPDILYHGTATIHVANIYQQGLIKGKRHHVHLSADIETAQKVGQRHGKLHLFSLKAKEMHEAGFVFYESENGVWLTDNVPPEWLLSVA